MADNGTEQALSQTTASYLAGIISHKDPTMLVARCVSLPRALEESACTMRCCARHDGRAEWGKVTLKLKRTEWIYSVLNYAGPMSIATAFLASSASPATAQVTGPFIGIVPRQSQIQPPTQSPAQTGLADQFSVRPAVSTVYDSNPLRLNELRGGSAPRSDVRVTPGIAFEIQQNFARNSISVTGAVGYDFYRRFKNLERVRTDVTATGSIPFGGRCKAIPKANFLLQQADIEDVGIPVGQTLRSFDAQISASCRRSWGFFPVASVGILHLSNSGGNQIRNEGVLDGSSLQNRRNWNATGGVAYAKPSLGELQLFLNVGQLRRPGVGSGADVTSLGLQFDRSISSRFAVRAAVSVNQVDTTRASAPRFRGVNFAVNTRVALVPSIVVSPYVSRQIAANTVAGIDYAIANDVGIGIDWSLGRRGGIIARVSQSHKRYYGEDPLVRSELRISDTTDSAGAAFRYSVRALQLRLGIQRQQRKGRNAFYSFDSTRVELAAGASF
jgi:hypothetical protein